VINSYAYVRREIRDTNIAFSFSCVKDYIKFNKFSPLSALNTKKSRKFATLKYQFTTLL